MRSLLVLICLIVLGFSAAASSATGDSASALMQRVRLAHRQGGGTVELADCEYHFYSSSATNMRFHVSGRDGV